MNNIDFCDHTTVVYDLKTRFKYSKQVRYSKYLSLEFIIKYILHEAVNEMP